MADENTDGLVLPVGLTEKQFLQQIARMETRLAKFESGTVTRFKKNNAEIAGSFTGMSRQATASLQNVSFQLQDIFVQIQGGQGAVRALSQQMPQLLSGFGAFGAVAGLAAAALSPLVAQMFSAAEQGKSTKEAVDGLSKSIDAYIGYLKTASSETETLVETYGRFGGRVRELSEYMARVALAQSMDELQASIEPIKGSLADVAAAAEGVARAEEFLASIDRSEYPVQWQDAADAVEVYRAALDEAAAITGLTTEQAIMLEGAINRVGEASALGDMAALRDAASAAAAKMEEMFSDGLHLPGPLRDAYFAMNQIALSAGQAAQKEEVMYSLANQIKTALADIWGGTPGSGWLAGEIADAASLAQRLWDAAKAKAAALNTPTSDVQGGRGADPRTFVTDPYYSDRYFPDPAKMSPKKSGGGGGGGGGGGSNGKLDALIEDLKTEREILEEWYAESLALLTSASEAELEALGGKHAAIERLEAEHQDRMAEIKEEANRFSLEMALGAGADVLSAMGSFNKKALRISQAFAAAEALVSTYQGAAAELRNGTLGFARAAAVLAKGLAFVGAIKGINEGGGGAARGGGATAAAAPVLPVQRIDISASGSPDFMAGMQSLIDTLSAAAGRGLRVDPRLVAA